MNVQSTLPQNYAGQMRSGMPKQKKQVAFGATPQQIFRAMEKAGLNSGSHGCGGTETVKSVVDFFRRLEERMPAGLRHEHKLGERNTIPEGLKGIEVDGKSLSTIDDELHQGAKPFTCGDKVCPLSTLMNPGKIVKNRLIKLGVERPDVIEIVGAGPKV